MTQNKATLIIVNLVLVLAFFFYSTYGKEQILKEGDLVLFELAPVDPRSLMQGDYMILDYEITQEANRRYYRYPVKGYIAFYKNNDGVAEFLRVQKKIIPLEKGEQVIKYHSDFEIGASSYFFQEGKGHYFEQAKYGGLRINSNGEAILEALYDSNRKKIVEK